MRVSYMFLAKYDNIFENVIRFGFEDYLPQITIHVETSGSDNVRVFIDPDEGFRVEASELYRLTSALIYRVDPDGTLVADLISVEYAKNFVKKYYKFFSSYKDIPGFLLESKKLMDDLTGDLTKIHFNCTASNKDKLDELIEKWSGLTINEVINRVIAEGLESLRG